MFTKILTAVDGSDHSSKAVEIASDIADKFNAALCFVSVQDHKMISDDVKKMAEVEHLTEPAAAGNHPNIARVPLWMEEAVATAEVTDNERDLIDKISHITLERAVQTAHERNVKQPKTISEHGDPATLILEAAARENADLIVIGSRGLGNVQGALFGSVSQKVLHEATCPCMVVR